MKHRFVTGLSDEIRDKCYNSTPVPESLGDWISKAYSLQTAQDIKEIYSRGNTSANRGRMPGRLSPQVQGQGQYPYRRPYNPQQGFNRPQSQLQNNPQQGQQGQ